MHAADSSHVAAARQGVQRLARALEFDDVRQGRAAIVATEAVTNMLKHAGGGTFLARPIHQGAALGLEMLAIDRGPGMADFAASSRDGFSSSGTAGTGLGAIGRQSDAFDVFTLPGEGTILRMSLWAGDAPEGQADYDVGVVCVPKEGEDACGDGWAMHAHAHGATFLVSDGLGHGIEASRASASAIDAFQRLHDATPERILEHAHGRLRATRGAAVSVMRHRQEAGTIDFAGVGNIAATVIAGTARRAMVSVNGIVGHNMHRLQPQSCPWGPGELLVVHSDGLETHWNLAGLPGIGARHPAIIAAALFRRHWRRRDDVTVLVARHRAR